MSMTPNIKCIITDDEPLARKGLQGYIEKIDFLELVGVCEDAIQLNSLLKQQPADLLFLDIEMPYVTGIDFLKNTPQAPKVIFTTAYEQYAIKGYELDVLDYLLKPISFERFLKAVNKVLQLNISAARSAIPAPTLTENQNGQSNSFLYFRTERKMVKVFFRDILYVEGLKDYIKIVTDTKPIITKYVLSTLEEMLPANEFLRIHKSYIIAINKIDSYNADMIQVAKHELPIGRLYKFDVNRVLNASSAIS